MFGLGSTFVIMNKLRDFNWGLLLVMTVIALIGFAALFSVADGHAEPWAKAQMIRFMIGLGIMAVVAMVDLRIWMALAYPAYLLALLLLVGVDLFGTHAMGAQRWLDIGPLTIQPSEIMKISLVLALARYYHGLRPESVSHILYLIPPAIMVGLPVGLVALQPDLGTALLLTAGSALLIFIAGLSWRIIFLFAGLGLAAIPVAWGVLHDYQRDRVYIFLDPSRDPMGAGYHITQSKIALGSGGIFGKGYMQGTQSHLNFLPEKQTDFIFTMFGEEWGFIGCVALLALYLVLLGYGLSIAQRSRSHFGRLVAMGILSTFLLYILINTAMVMGLVPVVGVPLPLVSYGGTAMMTMMFGFGLIMCVHLHRQTEIPRYPGLFL
jgi:rod shape determining protein RodA